MHKQLQDRAIKQCADLLDLPILQTPKESLPPALQEQWSALRRTHNIISNVSRLDFDLVLDRHLESIELHSSDVLRALEPLNGLIGGKADGLADIQSALKEFDTTEKIVMGELVSLIAMMQIYAVRS